MVDNYERILGRIAEKANLEKAEIERRVEAKRARLSGLISREGAAQVVAAELGINFDNERLKIEELLPGMKKVNVVGKIIKLSPVRTFTTRKGDEGKVVNIQLADATSNVKVVLWDTNHIELVEKGLVKEGIVVEINNGSIRDEEIHLGSFSEFKISKEILENVNTDRAVREKTIKEFKTGDSATVRAFIVQSFEPRFFHVCPECSKKVVSGPEGFICAEHGKVDCDKRALINIVIDDGTETIRAVAFHEKLKELGLTELEDKERLTNQREDLLGKELLFRGNVRMNNFFNNHEFILDEVKVVNLDELILGLEK